MNSCYMLLSFTGLASSPMPCFLSGFIYSNYMQYRYSRQIDYLTTRYESILSPICHGLVDKPNQTSSASEHQYSLSAIEEMDNDSDSTDSDDVQLLSTNMKPGF